MQFPTILKPITIQTTLHHARFFLYQLTFYAFDYWAKDFMHIVGFMHQSEYIKFAFGHLFVIHAHTFNCAV